MTHNARLSNAPRRPGFPDSVWLEEIREKHRRAAKNYARNGGGSIQHDERAVMLRRIESLETGYEELRSRVCAVLCDNIDDSAALAHAIEQRIESLEAETQKLEGERDEVKAAFRILQEIADGGEPTGNEPEWICPIVEEIVCLRRKLDA